MKKIASEDLRKLGVNLVTAGAVGFGFKPEQYAALYLVVVGLISYVIGLYLLVIQGETAC